MHHGMGLSHLPSDLGRRLEKRGSSCILLLALVGPRSTLAGRCSFLSYHFLILVRIFLRAFSLRTSAACFRLVHLAANDAGNADVHL